MHLYAYIIDHQRPLPPFISCKKESVAQQCSTPRRSDMVFSVETPSRSVARKVEHTEAPWPNVSSPQGMQSIPNLYMKYPQKRGSKMNTSEIHHSIIRVSLGDVSEFLRSGCVFFFFLGVFLGGNIGFLLPAEDLRPQARKQTNQINFYGTTANEPRKRKKKLLRTLNIL